MANFPEKKKQVIRTEEVDRYDLSKWLESFNKTESRFISVMPIDFKCTFSHSYKGLQQEIPNGADVRTYLVTYESSE